MSQFKLPEKWCVQITENNRNVLEKYRLTIPYKRKGDNETCLDNKALNKFLISDDQYSERMYWGIDIPEGYTLLSFEDFQKYILNQETITEDLSYLIDFINNKQIK
jgi:hypothetical protein